MASSSQPTPNEEIFLVWLFMNNLEEVRKDRVRFEKMFRMQKNIRARIGWKYRDRTSEEMLQDSSKILDAIHERFAFSPGWEEEHDG